MSDSFDENGLTLKTLTELVDELTDDLKDIYGSDINVDSDSPDGQMINIISQLGIDMRELIEDVNSGFDPDQAQGTILDQRVGINGIQRNGATFTQTPISITVDRALTLQGLDGDSEATEIPSGTYTVKDDAGNQFALIDTEIISAAGTYSLLFRAVDIGNVEVTLNTITTAVTAIAGVTGINNPSGVTYQGVDEESDVSLRLRRQKSIAISSTGYLESIEARLSAVDGVSFAAVYENTDDSPDTDSIPGHGIWCIVEGGNDDDIAQAIYESRPGGIAMKGTETVEIYRLNGTTFTAKFDRPVSDDLYLRFTLTLYGDSIDEDYMKAQIVENVTFDIGEEAGVDSFVAYLKGLNTQYKITLAAISDNGTDWVETLETAAKNSRWILSADRITIS